MSSGFIVILKVSNKRSVSENKWTDFGLQKKKYSHKREITEPRDYQGTV